MRRLDLLLIDLVLVAAATVGALILRDNFYTSAAKLVALGPYLLLSVGVAALAFSALGLSRSVWRFSSLADYLVIAVGAVVTVAGAVALGFGLNRLEGVPRALPILQVLMIVSALVGVRVLSRAWHARRARPGRLAAEIQTPCKDTVLVIGLNRLTALYLRSVAEFAPGRVRIAGLLGRLDRHTGRIVQGHPILGTPEQLVVALRDLEVHGVRVDRILVTMAPAKLSADALRALRDVEEAEGIRVDFLAERLGLGDTQGDPPLSSRDASPPGGAAFSILDLEAFARRPYWRVKRVLDIVVALCLALILAPIVLAVTALVAMSAGSPVIFWQQRPGRGGRPFRMYKFRTMAEVRDADGRQLPDTQRLSAIGWFLRRTRLDELPQIYNILAGDMSFVGPRPLLPMDQPAAFAARLLVRPGLTGWAQVAGGRDVSAPDKAALDVWYIRNASLALDAAILLRTVPFAVFGERTNAAAVNRAWRELRVAGLCASGERVPGEGRAQGSV